MFKLLGPSSSVTETTSTSSELLEGESRVRGMLNQLNSGMFLNCSVNVKLMLTEKNDYCNPGSCGRLKLTANGF